MKYSVNVNEAAKKREMRMRLDGKSIYPPFVLRVMVTIFI